MSMLKAGKTEGRPVQGGLKQIEQGSFDLHSDLIAKSTAFYDKHSNGSRGTVIFEDGGIRVIVTAMPANNTLSVVIRGIDESGEVVHVSITRGEHIIINEKTIGLAATRDLCDKDKLDGAKALLGDIDELIERLKPPEPGAGKVIPDVVVDVRTQAAWLSKTD